MPHSSTYIILWFFMLADMALTFAKYHYARGTKQRYVFMSLSRANTAVLILAFVAFAIYFIVHGHPGYGVLYLAIAGLNTYTFITRPGDDDFWTKTGQKIKKGVRDLLASRNTKVVPVHN